MERTIGRNLHVLARISEDTVVFGVSPDSHVQGGEVAVAEVRWVSIVDGKRPQRYAAVLFSSDSTVRDMRHGFIERFVSPGVQAAA